MARSKDIGTFTETAVLNHLTRSGFPAAKKHVLSGANDVGDIWLETGPLTGLPTVIVEVKGGHAAERASDGQIADWIEETERERVNAGAEHAFLVTKRKSVGAPNAHRWHAYTTVGTLMALHGHQPPLLSSLTIVRLHLGDMTALLRAAGYGAQQ